MLKTKSMRKWLSLLAPLALVPFFHNCTPVGFDKDVTSPILQESGNGGAYEGKLTRYAQADLSRPCSQLGANGKPLPNNEIFIFENPSGTFAQVVREKCSDLATPLPIDSSKIQVASDGSGQLIYNGVTYFDMKNAGDFDVIASSCPVGKNLLANPLRKNLLASGLDLMGLGWIYRPALQISVAGALASLPKYQLARTPDGLLWYHRLMQDVPLTAGVEYSFTFVAEKGNVSEVYVSGWIRDDLALNVFFDLNTGTGRDVGTNAGFGNVSFSSRPLDSGYIVTVYFTAPVTGEMYIGPTPAPPVGANGINDGPRGQVGDNIFAASAQMEEVRNYCTP